MNSQFTIRPFQESDKSEFVALIRNYWNANHVFLQSPELLWWQYEGYGCRKGVHFPVLFAGNRMIGFRGFFPAEVRIPIHGMAHVESIMVAALFLVIPEYQKQKLGLALQQYAMQHERNFVAIASNLRTSAPMHRKSGYLMRDQMLRYVTPLCDAYVKLMLVPNQRYKHYLLNGDMHDIAPVRMTAAELETFWIDSLQGCDIVCLNKSRDFWQWRFLDHPIYHYLFFGGINQGGVIVARVCDLYDAQQKREEKVFRILELIPEDSSVWNGGVCDEKLVQLLHATLRWAQRNGCVGAEFYVTTHRFSAVLEKAGMKEVNETPENRWLNIVSYFEPVASNERLSNVSLCLSGHQEPLDFENVYFSLSDADQDRPNIVG